MADKSIEYSIKGNLKWSKKCTDCYIVMVVKYRFYGYLYTESTISKLNVRNVSFPSNRGVRYISKAAGLEYRYKIS